MNSGDYNMLNREIAGDDPIQDLKNIHKQLRSMLGEAVTETRVRALLDYVEHALREDCKECGYKVDHYGADYHEDCDPDNHPSWPNWD